MSTPKPTSPKDLLAALGLRVALFDHAWESKNRGVWYTVPRYIDTQGAIAIAHLVADGYGVNIDADRGGRGLFVTVKAPHGSGS